MGSYPALDVRYDRGPDTNTLEELLYAALDDFEPMAIHELEEASGCRVFFATAAGRDAAASALTQTSFPQRIATAPLEIPDDDWAARSQAALEAVRIGHIVVAPPWDVPGEKNVKADDVVIVIAPSVGFGTGHHETTRLCLRLLQKTAVEGRRVIDVGTGSGVLAIAAWRLGAGSVLALDYDPDALESARDNIARNGATDFIELQAGDLATVRADPGDVVTANLTWATIRRHSAALRRLVRPGGHLIVSGFAPDESDDIVAELGAPVSHQIEERHWVAALILPK